MSITTDLTTYVRPRVAPVLADYDTPLLRFLRTPPKSSFKAIFTSSLRYKLIRMSLAKAVPEGLKDQECERGRGKRPPIPYVPVVDPVQDAVNTKERPMKIKLPDKTEISVAIWNSGTPEAFLIHVREAISVCKRRELFLKYDNAVDVIASSDTAIKLLRRTAKRANEPATPPAEPVVPGAPKKKKTKSKETTAQVAVAEDEAALDDEESQGTSATDPEAVLPTGGNVAEELARVRAEKKAAQAKRNLAAGQFFACYASLLSEDARYQWDKIVSSQVDTAPWTDLRGRVQPDARVKSYLSFMDCVTLHLQTVFSEDAAERQRYYISNTLKKPQRVPVRFFFQRLEQLNGYLSHLPSAYNSQRANAITHEVQAYDEAELASLALRMCPESWQDQYDLNQESVLPTSMRKLLAVLETIEKMTENQAAKDKTRPAKQDNKTDSEKSGKRKGMSSSTDRIPKKAKSFSERFCQLCKTHGGPHTTHNTKDCRKYEKDGTKAKGGRADTKSHGKPGNSFAQLTEKLSKLEKLMKKSSKKASRKRRRRDDSDSSDSDDE